MSCERPIKGIVALGNAANSGRLYASGALKLAAAECLEGGEIGMPAGIGAWLLGRWNISSATGGQERAAQQWAEAFEEDW